MARKDNDTSSEQQERDQGLVHGPASNTSSTSESEQSKQTEQSEQGERSTHGLTFTAEGGTPAQQEFSDSDMVQQGEWNPQTHGEPPDARPKRNY